MLMVPWQHYTITSNYVTVTKHMAVHSISLVAPTCCQQCNSQQRALSGPDCIVGNDTDTVLT